MKRTKTILSALLITAIAVTLVAYAWHTLTLQHAGALSPGCRLTSRSAQFVEETFGGFQSLPELLQGLEDYAVANFRYDHDQPTPLVQDFDFDAFARRKTGICWDFSAFAECTVLLWAQAHDLPVESYIVDMRPKDNFFMTHSYNYVIDGQTIYALDLTPASNNKKPWGVHSFSGDSLKDIRAYAENMGENIYRYQ